MRLLLDAHVSGPRVGGPLAERGHDVRALDQEPELEGLEDEDVLALATEDERILVTHNVADFPETPPRVGSGRPLPRWGDPRLRNRPQRVRAHPARNRALAGAPAAARGVARLPGRRHPAVASS